jgi:hypothetical protein
VIWYLLIGMAIGGAIVAAGLIAWFIRSFSRMFG